MAAVLFFTGFAAFWAPLPLFFTDVRFDSGQIFALYLVSSLASAVLYEGAGRFASTCDVRLLQSAALAVRGLLFPAVALVAGIGAVSVGLGVAGVGLAAIGLTWAVIAVVGTAIVTRLAPRASAGTCSASTPRSVPPPAESAACSAAGRRRSGTPWPSASPAGFLLGAGLVFSLRALSGGTHAVEPAADTPLDHAGTETGATPSAVAADDGDQTD
ncbi:hypothetical protein ACFQL4_27920 [Halosimplex aquaticum]